MPREVQKNLAAALSLFVMSFMKLAVIIAWHKSRSQNRKRVLCAMIFSNRKSRAIWIRNRISEQTWWDSVVPQFDEQMWIEHFRMKKSSFKEIVDLVGDEMKPGKNQIRQPICLRKRVAAALLYLASGLKLEEIGALVGISGASVFLHLHRFCNAIINKKSKLMIWPNNDKASEMAKKNFQSHKIAQVFGAIGSFHIPILRPKKDSRFDNALGWSSIIMQAVVDEQCRFMGVTVGNLGSESFESVFTSSPLFQESKSLLPLNSKMIQNTSVPLLLIGGSGYPLLPWLITPYQDCLTPEQESFNNHMKTMQQRTEVAFTHLLARWHILQKPLGRVKNGLSIVKSCCLLHNFCERKDSRIVEDWFHSISYSQPCNPPSQDASVEGEVVRDALCMHLAESLLVKDGNASSEVDYGSVMEWE